jgi:hypothetical protein
VIQPKFMGSNISFYLHKNSEVLDYAISRGGYKLNPERIEGLTELLDEWNARVFAEYPDSTFVLLQGELMPWSALGSNLIDKDFRVIAETSRKEIELLKKYNFESQCAEFKNQSEYKQFLQELEVSKKELKEKYGQSKERWFRNFHQYGLHQIFLEDWENNLINYERQLEIYGGAGQLRLEPFQVIKVDDQVFPLNNFEGFTKFNESKCYTISSDNFELAQDIYEDLTRSGDLEGVVIKPLQSTLESIVPYIKVRNSEYLRLVYGINYDSGSEYERILKNKNIRRKLKTSLREWQLVRKLLQNPSEEIKIELFIDFLKWESTEKELDPRL